MYLLGVLLNSIPLGPPQESDPVLCSFVSALESRRVVQAWPQCTIHPFQPKCSHESHVRGTPASSGGHHATILWLS